MKSIIEPNRVRQIESETVHFFVGKAVRLPVGPWVLCSADRRGAIRNRQVSNTSARRGLLALDRIDNRDSCVAFSVDGQAVRRPQTTSLIFQPPLAIRWQTTYSSLT